MTANPLGRTGKRDRKAAKDAEERKGKTGRAHGLGLEFPGKIFDLRVGWKLVSGVSFTMCESSFRGRLRAASAIFGAPPNSPDPIWRIMRLP